MLTHLYFGFNVCTCSPNCFFDCRERAVKWEYLDEENIYSQSDENIFYSNNLNVMKTKLTVCLLTFTDSENLSILI